MFLIAVAHSFLVGWLWLGTSPLPRTHSIPSISLNPLQPSLLIHQTSQRQEGNH
eukprot:UN21022